MERARGNHLIITAIVAGAIGGVMPYATNAVAGPKAKVTKTAPKLPTTPDSPTPSSDLEGKWSLYKVTRSGSFVAGTLGAVDVKCKDADDIPVSGACYTAGDGQMVSTRHRYWTTASQRSQWECKILNDTSATIKLEAEIVCQRFGDE